MLVSEVMTGRPVTVRADSSVKEALEVLAAHQVSALPVVDHQGRIAGVVSEADLIRELVPPDRRAHALPVLIDPDLPHYVGDVMTPHAVTVSPYTDVATAVELITSTAVKSVPVVDERDHVVGVLSRADVVRVLARADEELRRQVGELLVQLGLDEWDVEVHDGVAELDGPDDEREFRLADTAASSVSGVVRVRRHGPDLR
jgi:CBS-domain-containing membrane protein